MKNSAIKPIDAKAHLEILAKLGEREALRPSHEQPVSEPTNLRLRKEPQVWIARSSFVAEDRPAAHGDTDGSAKSAQNLNAQFKAKATNVPHGPHTFASQQVFTSQDASDLAGAFSSDTSPLGKAWNQVVSGVDDGGTAKQALLAEVKDKIKSIVPVDQVDDTAQAIVDFADGLHDRAMTPIRNIR